MSRASASGRKTPFRNSSTPSTTSTMRRRASSRPTGRGGGGSSTPRPPTPSAHPPPPPAPAGFFPADGAGEVVYLNATLANWLDHDLAQVGSGGLKLTDIVAGDGASLIATVTGLPGGVRNERFDLH